MMISDKYNVKGLMEICRYFLISNMTISNLYRAAILGHMCNDEVLKDAAMQKLVRSGKSVKDVDGWDDLRKFPDLISEILDFYSLSMRPDSCKPPTAKRCKL